jgi:NADH pyrophosphatase NudC (nudix superfamily)
MASAFFEKIGSVARNVTDKANDAFKTATDKANDALEINRINTKINGENQKISRFKAQLGEYIWTRFEAGDVFDENASEICTQIAACKENISEFEQNIQRIKEANAAPGTTILCSACGKQVEQSLKFCPNCGNRLADATEPEKKLCPNCGQELGKDQKFCGACGAKLEE